MVTLDTEGCRIREVACKSVLNKAGLVNCFAGCEHGCVYCYARFATRFFHPGEPWGSFVDIKINAQQLLTHEVRRKSVGRVFVSSVCDGWQLKEASCCLTRQCLEILVHHHYPLAILPKSALAGRDLDILTSSEGVEFGVTITTLDESLSKLIEPRGLSPGGRLALLEEVKRRGIKTYAFLGSLLPYLSDTEASLAPLLKAVKDIGANYFVLTDLTSASASGNH